MSLPAGTILAFAGDNIPSNCLLCDGRALVRTDWDLLFQAIGTKYGAPSPSQFNIPDYRDRSLYGTGAVVGSGDSDGKAIGSRGGPRHKHYFGQTSDGAGGHSHSFSGSGSTDTQGSHSHSATSDNFALTTGGTGALGSGGSGRILVTTYNGGTNSAGSHAHGVNVSGGTSGVGDHSHFVDGDTSGGYDYDMASYAGVNLIIATGKNV